ncbi:MAG TPA: isocitrate dehydrogenase, partial [Planctomycetota bacterium]|nr:isocitrate dehydrogenase [Planctomycetota bacterium]
MPERASLQVAEFLGDGIAPELSAAVHRVAAALPLAIAFHPVDLGLAARRQDAAACYRAAEAAIRAHGVA